MIKFRLYYDKDKEEVWLNEMAQSGFAMTHFFLGFYWFEACQKGEYIYQIDLLTEPKRIMTQTEYIKLAEETGAEYIGRWACWRFFRRKSELGEFALYTDISSKLEQYRRIFRFFRNVTLLEGIILLYEAIVGVVLWKQTETIPFVSVICFLSMILLTVAVGRMSYLTKKKIKQLESEII